MVDSVNCHSLEEEAAHDSMGSYNEFPCDCSLSPGCSTQIKKNLCINVVKSMNHNFLKDGNITNRVHCVINKLMVAESLVFKILCKAWVQNRD